MSETQPVLKKIRQLPEEEEQEIISESIAYPFNWLNQEMKDDS